MKKELIEIIEEGGSPKDIAEKMLEAHADYTDLEKIRYWMIKFQNEEAKYKIAKEKNKMTDSEKELTKENNNLLAKLVRRDKTIEDKVRELNRVSAVIHDMVEARRIDQSKIEVLMALNNNIDKEMLV